MPKGVAATENKFLVSVSGKNVSSLCGNTMRLLAFVLIRSVQTSVTTTCLNIEIFPTLFTYNKYTVNIDSRDYLIKASDIF